MVEKKGFKVLVTPDDVRPSREDLKVVGVFNPAAVRVGDEIVLLARVAETAREEREGYMASPWYDLSGVGPELKVEWIPCDRTKERDCRKAGAGQSRMRLAFVSHLRLIKLDATGTTVTHVDEVPTFYPQYPYEEFGVEDPRLTFIDGRYYFTYVAVSQDAGVGTALASTVNFCDYERHGIIFCRENKDVVLLPQKTPRGYCAYHRPVGKQNTSAPNMMCAFSPDLLHWGDHRVLMTCREDSWDNDRIGAGPAPILTDRGWLEIYHGVEKHDDQPIGVYRAGAALFDRDDPSQLIARSAGPIFQPDHATEVEGFVKNVVFPTGVVEDPDGEHLIVFSGGADSVITVMRISIKEVMDHLEPSL